MATIHHTTLSPSKLELLTAWMPQQSWYRGDGRPGLAKAGGFRLDDPRGEVGIEVLLVADADGTVYAVALTYRAAPLPGGERALVGSAEHGVLGRRWIYEAGRDPVAVAALVALARGQVVAQHQSLSDTPDPGVKVEGTVAAEGDVHLRVVHLTEAAGAPDDLAVGGGEVRITAEATPAGGAPARRVVAVVTSSAPG